MTEKRPWTTGPMTVYAHGEKFGMVWTGTDPETHGDPVVGVHRQRTGIGTTDWLAGSAYMLLPDAELFAVSHLMAEWLLKSGPGVHAECNCSECDEFESIRDKIVSIIERHSD